MHVERAAQGHFRLSVGDLHGFKDAMGTRLWDDKLRSNGWDRQQVFMGSRRPRPPGPAKGKAAGVQARIFDDDDDDDDDPSSQRTVDTAVGTPSAAEHPLRRGAHHRASRRAARSEGGLHAGPRQSA